MTTGGSRDASLYLMDYENAPPTDTAGEQQQQEATLEEQLLSYSENAENEGEEGYLDEEVLQVGYIVMARD